MNTWPEFRHRYEAIVVATWPRVDRRLWAIAADDLERLANPATLADVPGCLARFEAALIAEEVDIASLAIYLRLVSDALAWSRGGERMAA